MITAWVKLIVTCPLNIVGLTKIVETGSTFMLKVPNLIIMQKRLKNGIHGNMTKEDESLLFLG